MSTPHDPKPAVIIGSKEFVDFPDFAVTKVPARVDTGADGSSIWASDIHLNDGHLVFTPFAPGSVLYRDEPIATTTYRSTVVKNSFGVKEFRYKVKLRVQIGGRTINCWFSLADRSNNTYPVLLGRNLLRGKFVVDVARQYVHSKDEHVRKVLIFAKDVAENTAYFQMVREQNRVAVDYECVGYESLLFHINGSSTSVRCLETGTDIATYAFTYFKNHQDPEATFAAAEYLKFKGRRFVDHDSATFFADTKLVEYLKLISHGLPVPETYGANAMVLKERFAEIVQTLGLPFVLKAATSNRGRNNYIIDQEKDFRRILDEETTERIWLAQRYVPNDGFYRIYVLGKDADLAIWRAPASHENQLKRHLNKPRGSANANLVPANEVPRDVQQLALRSAACLDRQIAGVDLVQDKTSQKWYILEVNNGPQLRTGSFVTEKMAAVADFFDKELGR